MAYHGIAWLGGIMETGRMPALRAHGGDADADAVASQTHAAIVDVRAHVDAYDANLEGIDCRIGAHEAKIRAHMATGNRGAAGQALRHVNELRVERQRIAGARNMFGAQLAQLQQREQLRADQAMLRQTTSLLRESAVHGDAVLDAVTDANGFTMESQQAYSSVYGEMGAGVAQLNENDEAAQEMLEAAAAGTAATSAQAYGGFDASLLDAALARYAPAPAEAPSAAPVVAPVVAAPVGVYRHSAATHVPPPVDTGAFPRVPSHRPGGGSGGAGAAGAAVADAELLAGSLFV
jgi:hypothetical protein